MGGLLAGSGTGILGSWSETDHLSSESTESESAIEPDPQSRVWEALIM